jgi:predicted RNA methylase
MESLRHTTLYVLSRFITRAKAKDLKIPDKFAWESLFEATPEISLERFGRGDPCLIFELDRIFGLQKLAFDLSVPVSHREIMEVLNPIDMDALDLQTDILGFVYEDILASGSSKSRDMGQYFTDRSVCKYMVELCDPKVIAGVPETVCDPTMGTAGMLTCYVNYLNTKYPGIDWSKYQDRIHGCDHDERVAGLARINLFMVAKHVFGHLVRKDSLGGGTERTKYDTIVANPPFGLKNLKYADCHQSIKDLKISGVKAEPLFLQLMMTSLAVGGRCAVVVPNGMIENHSNVHNMTRKYLLDNFELDRVIRLKSTKPKGSARGVAKNAKFFVGTGVQCSILFFRNTGKPTAEIGYYELEKISDGSLSVTLIKTVKRDQIDQKTFSLDLIKYDDPIAVANGRTLESLCNHVNGETLKGGNPGSGDVPIMGGGTQYNGFYSKHNREPNTISISKSGTAGHVHWHARQFWAGDCFTMNPKDETVLNNRYLYHYLNTHSHLIKARNTGSAIPHCKWGDIKGMLIPVPDMKTQLKIVKSLDAVEAEKQNAMQVIADAEKKAFDLMVAGLA